jgi:tetraacyldisaccharide 4'-kinase
LKWQTAEALSQNENVDVIILDDGFQHLHLFRNLDILLLDATEDPINYNCVPAGRARESWNAIERAQLIFLTKCNLAAPKNLQFHREKIKGKEVFEFDYFLSSCLSLKGSAQLIHKPKRILLISALAKPESFKKLIEDHFPESIVASFEYRDHHDYSKKDLEKIKLKIAKENYEIIMTTEKDAVKLQKLVDGEGLPIWVVSLGLKPRFPVESLYEKIAGSIS